MGGERTATGVSRPAEEMVRPSNRQEGCSEKGFRLWPKRCKLAHAFLWKYIYIRLKLVQHLCQLGVFLTCEQLIAATVAVPAPKCGFSASASM